MMMHSRQSVITGCFFSLANTERFPGNVSASCVGVHTDNSSAGGGRTIWSSNKSERLRTASLRIMLGTGVRLDKILTNWKSGNALATSIQRSGITVVRLASVLTILKRSSALATFAHLSGATEMRFASGWINLKRRSAMVACMQRSVATSEEVEILDEIREGRLGEHPDQNHLRRVANLDLELLMRAAAQIRDRRIDSSIITFSPKVFIPLTRVCRDSCGYCTFALGPKAGQSVYMTVDEVLKIARDGVAAGCSEALFTLGDKPELQYAQAKKELAAMGYQSTISYVAAVAKIVLEETGLLPHINAGVMGREDVRVLRKVSVSQGLMLESLSDRLLEPGGPHFNCPDKLPSARLATIAAAGDR